MSKVTRFLNYLRSIVTCCTKDSGAWQNKTDEYRYITVEQNDTELTRDKDEIEDTRRLVWL